MGNKNSRSDFEALSLEGPPRLNSELMKGNRSEGAASNKTPKKKKWSFRMLFQICPSFCLPQRENDWETMGADQMRRAKRDNHSDVESMETNLRISSYFKPHVKVDGRAHPEPLVTGASRADIRGNPVFKSHHTVSTNYSFANGAPLNIQEQPLIIGNFSVTEDIDACPRNKLLLLYSEQYQYLAKISEFQSKELNNNQAKDQRHSEGQGGKKIIFSLNCFQNKFNIKKQIFYYQQLKKKKYYICNFLFCVNFLDHSNKIMSDSQYLGEPIFRPESSSKFSQHIATRLSCSFLLEFNSGPEDLTEKV